MKVKAFNKKLPSTDGEMDPDDISWIDDPGKVINGAVINELGFSLFEFTLGVKTQKYRFIVYVSDDEHVYADHDNCWSNAQLAAKFFYGKWENPWFSNTVLPALRALAREAKSNIQNSAKKIVRQWRAKYNRSIAEWKKKNMAHFLAVMEAEGLNREDIAKNRRIKSKTVINVDGKLMLAAKAFMSPVYRKRKYGWTREMETEYRAAIKMDWVKKTFDIARPGSDDVDPLLQSIIADPYQHGVFIKSIGAKALNECKEAMIHFMLGMKTPDILPGTKQNRYRRKYGHAYSKNEWTIKEYTDKKGRHYPARVVKIDREIDDWQNEGPPLYESGQLTNAIKTKIEIEKSSARGEK